MNHNNHTLKVGSVVEGKYVILGLVQDFRGAVLSALRRPVRPTASEESAADSWRSAILSHPKWTWTGIAVAFVSVLLMTLWHLVGEKGKTAEPLRKPVVSAPRRPSTGSSEDLVQIASSSGMPPSTLVGKDESVLHLIPEGNAVLLEDPNTGVDETVAVDAFYMDETEVTNHQYVLFLNENLPRISVQGTVVSGDGNIWLLLGEVRKGYEPIVFRDDRFSVVKPALHSLPVVRVTGYGALSYARFFGRRLPTELQWLRAMSAVSRSRRLEEQLPSSELSGNMGSMHEMMSGEPPGTASAPLSMDTPPVIVTQSGANAYGIRGLDTNVSEWGVESMKGNEPEEYVVLPQSRIRHPWEAFENVGFRTVMRLPKHDDSS